jgi:LPXTG-motif cell wall-anchored protein
MAEPRGTERAAAVKKLLIVAVTAVVMMLAVAQPASAQYQPMFITVSPTAVTSCGTDSGTVTVDAGYFTPGSDVVITLQSDPVTLGTVVASATGTVNATYTLPVGVTAGTHTVTASGTRLDNNVAASVSAQITVTIPPGCVSNQVVTTAPASSGSGTGNLPVTGSDFGIVAIVGAALLVAGGLIVMAARRRGTARA